jgi:hypothetical protein
MRRSLGITLDMVKAEAQRRITARYPLGKQNTIMLRAGAERDDMHAFIETIIAASHRLEAMSTVPYDYESDTYWTEEPSL